MKQFSFIHKRIYLFLCLVLCASILSMVYEMRVDAEESTVSMSLSDDGTILTICGEGEFKQVIQYNGIYGWEGQVDRVIIEDGITSIGDGAFRYFYGLEEIEIPNTVISIGNSAFSGCSSLKSVELPNTIISIGDSAFEGCHGLKSILFPDGLSIIGRHAFFETGIKEYIIPKSIVNIGDDAFSYYSWENRDIYVYYGGTDCELYSIASDNQCWYQYLTTAGSAHKFNRCTIIEEGTATNAGMAKYECVECGFYYFLSFYAENGECSVDNILHDHEPFNYSAYADALFRELYLPDYIDGNKVVSIGSRSSGGFIDQYTSIGWYLENVHIPESVSHFGTLFARHYELKDINIPSGLTSIDYGALAGTKIEEIIIPGGVETLFEQTFEGCSELKRVVLCEGVKNIDVVTFSGSGLCEIELPNTLEHIGMHAFENCDNLHSIIIPESVTKIEEYAFGMYYSNVYGKYKPYSDFVVYGMAGTEAERYANDSGLKFVALNSDCYSVTYMMDGGINNADNISKIAVGDADFLLKAPTKLGYEFEGWYSDKEYTHKVDKISASTKSNIILYAKWKYVYKVYGYQLSLSSKFDLVYYVSIADDLKKDGAYIEFTVGDDIANVTNPIPAGIYYGYTCEVPAKNIGDVVSARLVCGELTYELPEYSVKEYLLEIIDNKDNKPEYARAKETALAILDYSAYAQLYFGYKANDLVNSNTTQNVVHGLSDAYIIDSIDTQTKVIDNEDFSYIGASLICNSNTSLRLYFANNKNLSLEQIKEKYTYNVVGGSNPVADIFISDGLICIELMDIPAAELDNEYIFTLESNDCLVSVQYSPFEYIKQAMKNDNICLKNLCKALYLYSIEANKYYNCYSMPL